MAKADSRKLQLRAHGSKLTAASNANWIRFRALLFDAIAQHAVEAALQQRHQSCVPVAEDEQHQEWNRDEVLIGDRVPDCEREVGSDQKFEIRNPAETSAILLRRDCCVLLVGHTILRRARKWGLMSDERFHHSFGVGQRQPDSERHQRWQEEKRAIPGFREELLLRNQIEA